MLSGIQNGEGSGTGESLGEMGCLLGYLLGCLLVQSKINVEWVIVSMMELKLNILSRSCLNVDWS